MSSVGVAAPSWTSSTLLPVPLSRVARTWEGGPGPYLPKTCSSVTPPVIFMPVWREMSRRIWLRLELSAETESWPLVKITSARWVTGGGGSGGTNWRESGWEEVWVVGRFAGSCEPGGWVGAWACNEVQSAMPSAVRQRIGVRHGIS